MMPWDVRRPKNSLLHVLPRFTSLRDLAIVTVVRIVVHRRGDQVSAKHLLSDRQKLIGTTASIAMSL